MLYVMSNCSSFKSKIQVVMNISLKIYAEVVTCQIDLVWVKVQSVGLGIRGYEITTEFYLNPGGRHIVTGFFSHS